MLDKPKTSHYESCLKQEMKLYIYLHSMLPEMTI